MDLTGTDVCVLELEHSGHRLFFAVLLANHLANQGARTTLATSPEAIVSPQGREHLRFIDQRVEIADCAKSKGLSYWVSHFCQTMDKVVVLDGEGLVYQIILPKADPKKIVALMLHSPELYKIRPALTRLPKRALIRSARNKGYTIVNLASPGIVATERLDIAPDPSPFALLNDRDVPEGDVDLNPDRRWIGIFGGISARKGPELAVEAIAASRRRDLGLLIVGGWQDRNAPDSFMRMAATNQVEVVLVDRYVPTEALQKYMSTVDLVLVLNHNEGSSGILLGACSLNKSAILGGSSSLQRDARVLHLPWVASDSKRLAEVLRDAAWSHNGDRLYCPEPDGGDFTGAIMNSLTHEEAP